MTRTTCHLSMSLDGFTAGPDQSRDNPIGVGGLQLHDWHLQADEPGHEVDIPLRDELLTPAGAYAMGRNMFGPIRGDWDEDWRGWWGEDPPYHAPVFVVTHHAREPVEMTGGTTIHFVTGGFAAAFEQAKAAAASITDPARQSPPARPVWWWTSGTARAEGGRPETISAEHPDCRAPPEVRA